MYAGHAGVALALKARHPDLIVAPLVLACYGPDWVETIIRVLALPVDGVLYSHGIPAVVIGALLSALLYRLAFGGRGALFVGLGWLLHWPADFLTGVKPLLNERHMVGLHLYNMPWADLAMESVVLVAACALYWRVFGDSAPRRRTIVLMALALIAAQAGLDYFFASQGGWGFALAPPADQPHLSWVPGRLGDGPLRMPLAPEGSPFTESDEWRPMGPKESSRWSV